MGTKILKNGMYVMVLILSLASCKKEEKAKNNSFIYNQKEAQIGTAFGFQDGETEIAGVYSIPMMLFENTLTVTYENGAPESLSGRGDVLMVTFLTDKIDEIASGEYSLNSSTAASKAFTIDTDESVLLVEVVSFDSQPVGYLELVSGKATVVKNGSEYEITMNLKTTVNSTITGYYKGTPIIYSDGKKKTVQGNTWSHFNWVR